MKRNKLKQVRKQLFEEIMTEAYNKGARMFETYKANGGMCQTCGKNEAEYPHGHPNPYNCSECNAKARR
jgi:hypothetical protein